MSYEESVLDRHFRHWREQALLGPELEVHLREASRGLARSRAGSVVRTALGLLGGALLLAGLILVVAENWPALPVWLKLSGWVVILALVLLGACVSERSDARSALGEGLALVACGWTLGGIALVSQIYQLDARTPNGIWMWLALVLPAAWVLRSRAVSVAIFVALTCALALEAGASDSLVFARHPEGPWLFLAIPWLAASLVSWLPRPWTALRGWVGAWSFLAAQGFLLVLGAIQAGDRSGLWRAWILVVPGLLAALLFPRRLFPESWDATTARLFAAGTLVPWLILGAQYDATSMKDIIGVTVAWLVQPALAVLVIRTGARGGSRGWVNLGYTALLIGIVTRYFDFFGRYLEGGTALIGTGIVLLAVLYLLERSRRRTLRKGVAS